MSEAQIIQTQNLLKQKRKPTDLFMDEETGYVVPRREHNTYSTSSLVIGVNYLE